MNRKRTLLLIRAFLDEAYDVGFQFRALAVDGVHHVPALIVGLGDVLLQFGSQRHMVHRVPGGEIRRGEVEVAVSYEDLEIRVAADGLAQSVADVDVFSFVVEFPGMRAAGQDQIEFFRIVIQLRSYVIVEAGRENAGGGGMTGIGLGMVTGPFAVAAFYSAVKAADGIAFLFQEIFGEAPDAGLKIAVKHELLAKPGVGGQLFGHFQLFLFGKRRAQKERAEIFVDREALHFGQKIALLRAFSGFLVIVGDGGVSRQEENVGEIVAEVEPRGAEIKNGGDKDDAVKVHALLVVQVSGQARGARRAIAFAEKIFRGHPAAVLA